MDRPVANSNTGRLLLHEFGAPTVVDSGSVSLPRLEEANRRWKTAMGLRSNPIKFERVGATSVSLRAEGVTGTVRVGNVDIDIVPKFLDPMSSRWQQVLWRVLSVIEGGHVDESRTSATVTDSIALPDLLADVFLSAYSRGSARGLPYRYRAFSGEGSVVRGTFDTRRVSDWIARPWLIPYVSDALSDSTPLAALFRWTADVLSSQVSSPARSRSLVDIVHQLSSADRVPPHITNARQFRLDPQYQALDPARAVGITLLEGAGIHHDAGLYELSGFLWNSDRVYEQYVFWLCGIAAARMNLRVEKNSFCFGELQKGSGSPLLTIPDVVFRNSQGDVRAVLDSKYKVFGSRPVSSDTYQVLTAAHVLGCRSVSLAYPVGSNIEEVVWKVESKLGALSTYLTALPLNLMLLARPDGHTQLVNVIEGWCKEQLA